jgi:hypothetical protein
LVKVPDAVDAFDTVDPLQAAIYDLMIAGFSRYVISLLADRKAIDDKLGDRFWPPPRCRPCRLVAEGGKTCQRSRRMFFKRSLREAEVSISSSSAA